MKSEYDFSKGERGRFFQPNVTFNIPVCLEPANQAFVEQLAKKKKLDVSRTLKLVVAAGATLFGTGEFVTVTCILPAGNTLQASDFPVTILSNLEPADQLLAPVSGLTPTIAVSLY